MKTHMDWQHEKGNVEVRAEEESWQLFLLVFQNIQPTGIDNNPWRQTKYDGHWWLGLRIKIVFRQTYVWYMYLKTVFSYIQPWKSKIYLSVFSAGFKSANHKLKGQNKKGLPKAMFLIQSKNTSSGAEMVYVWSSIPQSPRSQRCRSRSQFAAWRPSAPRLLKALKAWCGISQSFTWARECGGKDTRRNWWTWIIICLICGPQTIRKSRYRNVKTIHLVEKLYIQKQSLLDWFWRGTTDTAISDAVVMEIFPRPINSVSLFTVRDSS